MHELPWRESSEQRSDTASAGQHHAYLTRQVGSIRVHGASEIMHENSFRTEIHTITERPPDAPRATA